MLTESIPVKHKTNEKIGAGIIVGNEVFNSVDASGKMKTSLIFLVAWENHPTITPHQNSELTHLVPIEDWYQDYFENLQGQDLEEYDKDEEFSLEDDNTSHIQDEIEDAPIVNLHETVSHDDALKDASSEFQE